MGAYIVRRLLLIIPTLFGMVLIAYVAAGMPKISIQDSAKFEGSGIGGRYSEASAEITNMDILDTDSGYVGARGLPKEFIEELEREFGFDQPIYVRYSKLAWKKFRELFTGSPDEKAAFELRNPEEIV